MFTCKFNNCLSYLIIKIILSNLCKLLAYIKLNTQKLKLKKLNKIYKIIKKFYNFLLFLFIILYNNYMHVKNYVYIIYY